MNKTKKIALTSVVLTLLLQAVVALAVVLSGAYDVAATVPHTAPVHWLLSKTTERSIAVRADEEPAFEAAADRLAGFESYDAMCVQCHGAPGVEPSWLGKGIYPPAPDLAHAASHRTAEQLRISIRRGIKFTAMPALESTHSAAEVDELTAFVLALGDLSPNQYAHLRHERRSTSSQTSEHKH